ncbi:hypothetical protein MLM_3255 [Mycobacterium lepraemurium]|nr:hypothetical protein MLM_3255 [Mycobacterium lepraemurium]
MLGPLHEYPVHQIPQPIAWPGSSDRNFYDRSYFNAHDRTENIFVISGIGYYPNLGVKDTFFLVRRGDTQTAVHLCDAIDQDRLNQHVNGYRIEVKEPLRKLRLVLDETEGVTADLTWEGLFDVVQEQPHILRSGNRVTLDAQRFAQLGSWSGRIVIDGQEIAVDPATWIGSRDRSWSIRPIGEPELAGRPADPPFEGMWWLYVPMAFDDFAIVLIIQEQPDGFRSLNDCTQIWRDGRVEQLGWPRVKTHYRSGTRIPTGATIEASAPDGTPVHFDVESKLPVPIHVDGGDSDWLHGMWKGEKFTERLTYDMTDPAIIARSGFGVIDHVGRAICRDGDKAPVEGWGLYEHGALRRHDPSGFSDWLTVAPQPVRRPGVVVAQQRPGGPQAFAQRRTRPLLGHNEFREIDEGSRGGHVGDVEPVDVGVVDPTLEFVGDLGRRPHQHRAAPADADLGGQLGHRPGPPRCGERRQRRAVGVGFHVGQRFVGVQLGQIHPAPAAEQGQRPAGADEAPVFGQFGNGRVVRLGDHRGHHGEHLDRPRVPAQLRGGRPQRPHGLAHHLRRRPGDEDRLGVGRGEADAAR